MYGKYLSELNSQNIKNGAFLYIWTQTHNHHPICLFVKASSKLRDKYNND